MHQCLTLAKGGTLREEVPIELKKINKILSQIRKESTDSSYKLELNGAVVPKILQTHNIERTKNHRMQNLLAVEYCRQYPPALFIKGTNK